MSIFEVAKSEIKIQMAEAEAQVAEAEAQKKAEEDTDVFYMQQEMTGALMDLLERQDSTEQIFVQPPAPVYKPPNYLLYIVAGLGLLIYFGKVKL